MRTTENSAQFCSGCPFANNFVGDVDKASFSVEPREQEPLTAAIEASTAKALGKLPLTHFLYCRDEFGMPSKAVGVTEGELSDQTRADLMARVGDCQGPSSVVTSSNHHGRRPMPHCRAISTAVVEQLTNNDKRDHEA